VSPDHDPVADALARLDDAVADGTVDLVEYWRRRAALESGQGLEGLDGLDGAPQREATGARSVVAGPEPPRIAPTEASVTSGGSTSTGGSLATGGTLSTGAADLVPPAPRHAMDETGRQPAPRGPVVPVGAPGAGSASPPLLPRPVAHEPFAPEQGAVVLDRHTAADPPPRRRWWRRHR